MAYDEVDRQVREHQRCAHRYYIEKQTPQQILAKDASCADDLELPAPYTYMQQVGSLDLAPLWKRIDAAALIIYGTALILVVRFVPEGLAGIATRLRLRRAHA